MALGTFTPPAGGKAGSFDPRQHADKPLIVVVREFREGFTTRRFPKPKDVVICDVVDVLADTVHVSVIWGSAAMCDRLKGSVAAPGQTPERLPVVIRHVTAASGNPYCTVDPLEGQALQLAAMWDTKYPTRIDDERAAAEAANAASAEAASERYDNGDQTGAPVGTAFADQAPLQGFGNGAPAPAQQQATPVASAPTPAAPAAMDDDAIAQAIAALS